MAQSASTYDEDQERLRRQYDGEPADDDIDESFIPKEPEVDPRVYRDVEPLLSKGFLHQSASIGGTSFVFKSLNHREFELVNISFKLQSGFSGTSKFYSCLLAYGLWMVDGVSVLPSRQENLSDLITWFESMNGGVRESVVRHLSELNRRANQATYLTEAYAMETASRIRWNQVRGLDLMSSSLTGIEGTTSLGYNWAQLIWRALNFVEDEHQRMENDWENAKFVASAMAGKGISRIHAKDRQRRRSELNDRRERKDRILRWAVLGEAPEEKQREGGQMIVARTVEDLSKQLDKDLRGEKDWHDLVIEAHEKRIQDNQEERQQYLRELHAEHEREMGGRELTGATDLRGLTRDEVERLNRERQQRILERLQRPGVQMDPKIQAFEEKWNSALPLSGKDSSNALPAGGVSRERTTPWRR